MICLYLIDHLCCLTKVSLYIESDNLLQRVSLSEDQTGHWVQSFHRGVLDNQNYQHLLRQREDGEIIM